MCYCFLVSSWQVLKILGHILRVAHRKRATPCAPNIRGVTSSFHAFIFKFNHFLLSLSLGHGVAFTIEERASVRCHDVAVCCHGVATSLGQKPVFWDWCPI